MSGICATHPHGHHPGCTQCDYTSDERDRLDALLIERDQLRTALSKAMDDLEAHDIQPAWVAFVRRALLPEREGDKLTVPCVRCGQDAYDSDTCADCDRELEGYRLAEREGDQPPSAYTEQDVRDAYAAGYGARVLAEREGDQP